MPAESTLTPEQLAEYRAGARRRQEDERLALEARETRAWEVARQAAAELRRQFPVTRVVVFGSLVHPGCFALHSDVDIAAWGLRVGDTFRAIGVAQDIAADIPVNLVDVNTCSAAMLRSIERDGVPL